MPETPEERQRRLQEQAQQMLAGLGGATATKPKVYFGQRQSGFTGLRDDKPGEQIGVRTGDDILDLDAATSNFYSWSDVERDAWGKRLYKAGMLRDPDDFDGMLKAWAYAVEQAAGFYTHAGRKITPWQVIDLLDSGEGPQGGPKTTKSTSKAYQIPSESEARAAITAIFQDQLGRDPTDGELSRYRSMWIGQARQNPAVTTTTTTTDPSGNTSSSSTTSGGFDPRGFLVQEAQGDPEYGALQSATVYYNVLEQLARSSL